MQKHKIDLTNLDDDDTDNEDNTIEDNNNNEDVGKYYILNISDQCDLTDGFRYIKELLLQRHNYKMFSDSVKLEQAGINIYSVKSDAFTIKKDQLELAKDIINFSSDIGGWRLSNLYNINFPSNMWTIIQNNKVEIKKAKH